ncbi:2TM domain-containing protein [Flaviramulus basaltis]|uniref:2TM domain-containing protein n=1 Tax=Flaviramulus basaltis TaxID=369401 RepID=A0A1K2ILS0_9FLAO|nr:2TM domain-containing protein [Flaviramulus basaltis]SFZ92619.1 2TM domain-containing protein [Flaviramulus basaltis]
MNHQFQDEERYLRAQKRVKEIKGFYRHLLWYVIVNVLIILGVVAAYGWDFSKIFTFNAYSTALFWGIGIAFHWIGVFGKSVGFSKKWEERKIKEFMDKDKF